MLLVVVQRECCKTLQKCTVITKFIKLSYFNHIYYCIKCAVKIKYSINSKVMIMKLYLMLFT